jgi:anti-sigma regulatory factor (Ser/Thr protein kinase)
MRGDERGDLTLHRAERGFDVAGEAELRAACRRQAAVIGALVRAVGDLRSGASALKAENAELRSERRRLHRRGAGVRTHWSEARVRLDLDAPAAARRAVAAALADRVAAPVIERAKLTISELITNSVRHSGVPEGAYAVVRLYLTDERLRLAVEDPGHGGEIVRRRADARTGRGFGLHVVETLSERWGSERHASGVTCVWAELSLGAGDADTAPPYAVPPRAEVHVVPNHAPGPGACTSTRTARRCPSTPARRLPRPRPEHTRPCTPVGAS